MEITLDTGILLFLVGQLVVFVVMVFLIRQRVTRLEEDFGEHKKNYKDDLKCLKEETKEEVKELAIEIKGSVKRLFEVIDDLRLMVHELKGWKNGQNSLGSIT